MVRVGGGVGGGAEVNVHSFSLCLICEKNPSDVGEGAVTEISKLRTSVKLISVPSAYMQPPPKVDAVPLNSRIASEVGMPAWAFPIRTAGVTFFDPFAAGRPPKPPVFQANLIT